MDNTTDKTVKYICLACGTEFSAIQSSRRRFCDDCIVKRVLKSFVAPIMSPVASGKDESHDEADKEVKTC